MDELRTDRELLREYAAKGAEGAFQVLVERHVDLVFATAMRGVKDEGAAREITQNVFIALARKAGWLSGEISLTGWLHRSARLEARRWWRGELRRQRREQTAVELGTVMKEEDSLLACLAGELDEGLLELREADRQALTLRYFEGRTHREIGLLLGAREDAVRMRIEQGAGPAHRLLPQARLRRAGGGNDGRRPQHRRQGGPGRPGHRREAIGRGCRRRHFDGLQTLTGQIYGTHQNTIGGLVRGHSSCAHRLGMEREPTNAEPRGHGRIQVPRDARPGGPNLRQADRLKSESARLDGALAATEKERGRYEAAAEELEPLRTAGQGPADGRQLSLAG